MLKKGIIGACLLLTVAITICKRSLKTSHHNTGIHDMNDTLQINIPESEKLEIISAVKRHKFTRDRKILTLNEIRKLAVERGMIIPEFYVFFLSIQNGGQPELNNIYFVENGEPSGSNIESFGRFCFEYETEGAKSESIEGFEELNQLRLSGKRFVFARDGVGNYYSMSTEKEDTGVIYFWDHETGQQHFVCNSFVEFLNSLELLRE
jgi:SMI1-KNR4 cell-wall